MNAVTQDGSVRAWISWRVEEGRLPRNEPLQIWRRQGRGFYCGGCGRVIESNELEYELEWTGEQLLRTIRMHDRCYRIWESERHPVAG
jgi:hypothetical protein